ncbi:MAG TPA: cytochrome P450 [Pyrinomonadaceae bacterium]|nr:cytochrome P450 [Pyrinomonadaceae bacterium]
MEVQPTNFRSETFTGYFPARQEKRVPGPRGRRLLGSLLEVRRDRLKFVTHATKTYGDLICFRMGPKSLYLLNHPDYARHVLCDNETNYRKGLGLIEARPLLGEGLLTSNGELWARQRRLLQVAFHNKRMDEFSQSMVDATHATVDRWANEKGLDIAHEMVGLTINILGSTLFRMDLSETIEDLSRDLTLLTRWAMSRMTSLSRLPMYVPTQKNRRARAALQRLESLVEKMIREHGEAGDNSLLSLMAAQESDAKQTRDEVMTLLLAGHETTAATLTWVWYLLSQHPDVERRLHAEVDQVLEGRRPTLSDVPRLVYTKMIVSETLRLYPPVWLLPRKTINPDRLDGHTIPANSDVLVCVYTIHRHPQFWNDAERFDPQRFAPDNGAERDSCAYLPFGAGPRTCLGSRFGLMEVMLVVATIAQRFSLRVAGNHKVEPEASLTLHPRNGLPVTLQRRAPV